MERQRTRAHLWLLLAAFALRAFAPAGYMPAPIAAGLPFVLCPGSSPVALASIANAGTHHHHAPDRANSADASTTWEFCPFGAVFAGAAPAAAYDPPLLALHREPPHSGPAGIVRSVAARCACRPRAPPTDSSIDV